MFVILSVGLKYIETTVTFYCINVFSYRPSNWLKLSSYFILCY